MKSNSSKFGREFSTFMGRKLQQESYMVPILAWAFGWKTIYFVIGAMMTGYDGVKNEKLAVAFCDLPMCTLT